MIRDESEFLPVEVHVESFYAPDDCKSLALCLGVILFGLVEFPGDTDDHVPWSNTAAFTDSFNDEIGILPNVANITL